jgi:sulfur relay (sulfurtransferase) DsrC/TusE family protein
MKIIITESQHKFLVEQMPEPGDKGYEVKKPTKAQQKTSSDYAEDGGIKNKPTNVSLKGFTFDGMSVDDLVDVISGIIDGVPGIGNLISAGIDVSHALSYGVRFYYAKDDDEKIEMGTLGIITLGAAALPVAGNALPIIARQGVKTVLRKTPEEILLIAKKLGIYKQTVFFLSKTKWKYNLILVLAKIFGYELIESLTKVVKYVRDLMLKINNSDIKRALKSLLELLNDILSDVNSINIAIKISKNLK